MNQYDVNNDMQYHHWDFIDSAKMSSDQYKSFVLHINLHIIIGIEKVVR